MPTDRPAEPETFPSHLPLPHTSHVASTGNMPALPTPLIGRAEELADLRSTLLRNDCRLVTLVGPPGVGKTRLALEVTSTSFEEFAEEAVFVDLTPIRDPALVIYALAEGLGLREGWSRGSGLDLPVMEKVKDALRERSVLLFLDNFEHVVEGAPPLGELLGACPGLKILATSRVPLHLQWEQQFPLSPLALPDLTRLPNLDTLAQIPAVAMFMTRARAVAPGFTLTEANGRAVAEICVRLDGLPLAIELVVARVKTFPLATIIDQLERRLEFLTGGARDLPERQQTLRSAIGWSYDLLIPGEQSLFRRLAVFAGGCDVEAAQAVCAGPGDPSQIVEPLGSLVDKNLLLWTGLAEGTGRYRMLESLREFGLEQLKASGETGEMHRRHAAHFLGLVEEAEPQLMGPDEARWHDRLEREHDNLRQALAWALDGGDPQVGVRLAGALRRFWNVRGHWSEGRMWIQRALDVGAAVAPAARAKVLYTGGVLAAQLDDNETATKMIEECLALRQSLGDRAGIADAIWYLGNLAPDTARKVDLYEQSLALYKEIGDKRGIVGALLFLAPAIQTQGDASRAKELFQETLTIAREVGEYRAITGALLSLGRLALEDGDYGKAQTAFMETLGLARKHGDKLRIAHCLDALADLAWRQGDIPRAGTLLGDALALARELETPAQAAGILRRMGRVAIREGNHRRAASLIEESLRLNHDLGDKLGIARTLEAVADLSLAAGRSDLAAVLALARGLRQDIGAPDCLVEESQLDRPLSSFDSLVERISVQAAGSATDRPIGETVQDAMKMLREMGGRPPRASAREKAPGGLTGREQEVVALVAEGLSNREIAKILFISERTVDSHLEHILTRLGFSSRAQIAAWAVRHGVT